LEFIAKTVQGFLCQASNPVPKSQNFIFFTAWFLETFWIYIVWAAAKHHAREVCPGA
jgi:hypothetical protein